MTPTKMSAWTIWVADLDGTICGMIAVNFGRAIGNAELEDFFVDPVYQGRRVGWALMSVVFQTCRSRSVRVLGVDADPNSGKIYRRFGFATVGTRAIAVDPRPGVAENGIAHNRGLRRS
jgi:GNAT superfamily N-acetyltransferase